MVLILLLIAIAVLGAVGTALYLSLCRNRSRLPSKIQTSSWGASMKRSSCTTAILVCIAFCETQV